MDARAWQRRFKLLVEFDLYVGSTAALAVVWHAWLGHAINSDGRGRDWLFSILIAAVPGAFLTAPFSSMGTDAIVGRIERREFRRMRAAEAELEN